jgi:hypothetical protein
VVEIEAPKGLLKKDSISVYYRTPDKRKENTPVDCLIKKLNDGKTIRIILPKQCAQYAVYWRTEGVFRIEDTEPSRDNCQITRS